MTPWYNNFGSVLADTLLFVRRDMLDDIIVRCTCVMYFYPSEEHLYLCDIYIYLSSQNAQKCLGHLTLCSNEVHKIRRQHQFVVKICWWRRISDCQSRQPIQSSVAGSRAGAGLLGCRGCVGGWMRDGRRCHCEDQHHRTHDGQGATAVPQLHLARPATPARRGLQRWGCSRGGSLSKPLLWRAVTDSTSRPAQLTGARRCVAAAVSPARARQVSGVWCGARLLALAAVAAVCGRVAGAGAGSQSVVWVSGVICLPRTECHCSGTQTQITRNQAHLNTIEPQWHPAQPWHLRQWSQVTTQGGGKIPLNLPLAAPDASSRHCLSRWSITVMSRRTAVFEMTAYPINPRE